MLPSYLARHYNSGHFIANLFRPARPSLRQTTFTYCAQWRDNPGGPLPQFATHKIQRQAPSASSYDAARSTPPPIGTAATTAMTSYER